MRIALFVTCPVDLFRPEVAEAVVAVLEALEYQVEVPEQSCCGQVGFNNGDLEQTRALAWENVQRFQDYDYLVIPSGSCGGMLHHHYPTLFAEGDVRREAVENFAKKVWEFTRFLVEVVGLDRLPAYADFKNKSVTYHDSCAGLRELGIQAQPRQALSKMVGVTVTEMPDTNVCCGFGGTFCVKYPDISHKMVCDKIDNARSTGADMLLGGDLSCLLNIAGALSRQRDEKPGSKTLEVRHVAEVLAGRLETPAIGETS